MHRIRDGVLKIRASLLQGRKPVQDEICHGFINNVKDFGCFVQLDGPHEGSFGLCRRQRSRIPT